MGLKSDLQNIRTHGSASAAELREFVARIHGRNPQEVLGLIAESGLIRATVQAAIGCVLLMFAFSVGPYLWAKSFSRPDASVAKSASPTAAAPAKSTETQPATDLSAGPAASTSSPDKAASNVDQAAKAMGIGETKPADPKKNPLDKDLDKLLDDIK